MSFTSKTELIDHYENTLGALHVGGHKMIIFPDAALKLIRKYYNFEIMGYVNEPDGVDFYVDPKPLTDKDKREFSEVIAYYKSTGRKKKLQATNNQLHL